MRVQALAILMMAPVLMAAPARAQTYDPAYPVCLQVYQGFVDYYFECAYMNMAQCQASASGRNLSCLANPYYSGESDDPYAYQNRGRPVPPNYVPAPPSYYPRSRY